ncbi:ATP-binding protein [Puteibacter caeruleilacunae]|nr:ATP-binding protein [Puteibacter caeruleilacunae]
MTIIANIKNSYNSFQRLINFYEQNKNRRFEEIEVELYTWFSANLCAVLGGIFDLYNEKLNTIKLRCASSGIEEILLKNEFLTFFGARKIEDNYHTTIPYARFNGTDGKVFSKYIREKLIERDELPNMSDLVKEKMREAIHEIFVNAQIHSESSYIYTCGQFFPRDNRIEFTIVDTGIGFKRKVNERFNSSLSGAQAIQWAIKDGHTTKEGVSGGIGLALLREFVEKNKGVLQIVSSDGYYEYTYKGEQLESFNGSFPGSIINLQFRTDDNSSYILKEEVNKDDIF